MPRGRGRARGAPPPVRRQPARNGRQEAVRREPAVLPARNARRQRDARQEVVGHRRHGPAGVARREPAGNQSAEEENAGRGQARRTDGDILERVEDDIQHSNAGRCNVIDFEQLLTEAQIISNTNINPSGGVRSNLDLNTNLGCDLVNRHNDNQVRNAIERNNTNALSNPQQEIIVQNNTPSSNNTMCNNSVSTSGFAVRLADDDIAVHLPTTLKQQICSGTYVNLSLMLKGAVELTEYCSGSVLRLGPDMRIETTQKECREKITDIEKWTNAFLIYASVYLSNHTDKIYEMLHYMYNIREAAMRQGSLSWREYDEQFRLRQAVSPTSWSKINNDLWWRCMQMRPTGGNGGRNTSNLPRNVCHGFNSGGCTWPNCRFAHICSNCQGPHPEPRCTRPGARVFPQTQPQPSSGSSFRGRPFNRRGTFRPTRRN